VNPDRARSGSPSVREIASPKILKGLKFKTQRSGSIVEENKGSTEESSPNARSPDRDVRVKTNINPAHIRNSSMMNSQAQS
jgi:hypothetical protein